MNSSSATAIGTSSIASSPPTAGCPRCSRALTGTDRKSVPAKSGQRAAEGAQPSRGEMTSSEQDEIWIGLDTGGTFTDAVALNAARRVIASAKALTTHWDLSVGLGEAIRAVLAKLPGGVRREHISLVSVSTTLATNAVVESRFSPICT